VIRQSRPRTLPASDSLFSKFPNGGHGMTARNLEWDFGACTPEQYLGEHLVHAIQDPE
jgi:hypothetical protein